MEEVKPPPVPKPKIKSAPVDPAPKIKSATVREKVVVSSNDNCRPMTLKAIRIVFDRDGIEGLSREAIDYYNKCIKEGVK